MTHSITVNMDDTNDKIRAHLKSMGYPNTLTDWQLWLLKNTIPGAIIYNTRKPKEPSDPEWEDWIKHYG